MNPCALLTTALLLLAVGLQAQAQIEADVIVYGSTPGGSCAAIAAASEGASVILLEPTKHVGGMTTGQDLAVQNLPYETLRPRLLARKQALDLPQSIKTPSP